MFRSTYELQRLDVFRHLNGNCYQIDDIQELAGDNYKLTCIDNKDNLVEFVCDVHTQFQIIISYKVVNND
jgi:hypothetical protein